MDGAQHINICFDDPVKKERVQIKFPIDIQSSSLSRSEANDVLEGWKVQAICLVEYTEGGLVAKICRNGTWSGLEANHNYELRVTPLSSQNSSQNAQVRGLQNEFKELKEKLDEIVPKIKHLEVTDEGVLKLPHVQVKELIVQPETNIGEEPIPVAKINSDGLTTRSLIVEFKEDKIEAKNGKITSQQIETGSVSLGSELLLSANQNQERDKSHQHRVPIWSIPFAWGSYLMQRDKNGTVKEDIQNSHNLRFESSRFKSDQLTFQFDQAPPSDTSILVFTNSSGPSTAKIQKNQSTFYLVRPMSNNEEVIIIDIIVWAAPQTNKIEKQK